MDAIITAGGRIRGKFAERTGMRVKALLEVRERPVICTVVSALRGLPEVERILVVGPEELDRASIAGCVDEIVPEAADGAENLLIGLERCSAELGARAIFAASDLPFLTTEALRGFIDKCPLAADFCYPVLRREQFLAAYPGRCTRFAPLKDGWYIGGCVFLLNPQALLANRKLIERIFAARKSLLKLASILGWGFVLRLVTHSVDIETCVRRGSELIGCDCRAILDSPPELAYDLDDLADYEYALTYASPK